MSSSRAAPVPALDALLAEVAGLRRALATDLALAASAADAGADALAAGLLQAGRARATAFEERALAHVRALAGGA